MEIALCTYGQLPLSSYTFITNHASIEALDKNIKTTLSLTFTFSPPEVLSSFLFWTLFVSGRQRPSLFAWFAKEIDINWLVKIAVTESSCRLLLLKLFSRILSLENSLQCVKELTMEIALWSYVTIIP